MRRNLIMSFDLELVPLFNLAQFSIRSTFLALKLSHQWHILITYVASHGNRMRVYQQSSLDHNYFQIMKFKRMCP